jgi:eukaryotic-like serine/threonine-protein kinase
MPACRLYRCRKRTVNASSRADIFAFGSLLYEMATGTRAWRRETAAETMTAILREDVPELPSPVTAAAPGLAPIIAHCLEKRPEDRFQSARDLAFDLRTASGSLAVRSRPTLARASASAPSILRRWRGLGWLLAGVVAGATGLALLRPSSASVPAKTRRLTFSGADTEPSAAPDGRLVAFTSTRDGTSRIWIKQLAGGGEQALTAGPDRLPRFSPDASSVLFVRDEGQTQSVYRVALVGGEPRKLVHDAVDADWSPDGRQVVFVRTRTEPGRSFAGLYVADVNGQNERRLLELENAILFGVRWSPDGGSIAVTRANVASTAVRSGVIVVDVASGREHTWTGGDASLPLSAPLYLGDGREIVVAQRESAMGSLTAAQSRVMGLDTRSGRERLFFWAADLFPAGGNSSSRPSSTRSARARSSSTRSRSGRS